MTLHEKAPPELRDPRRVAIGRASVRRRWDADAIAHGKAPGRRVVRLDSLDSVTAGIIRTILAARAHAAEADEFTPDERSLADAVVKAARKNAKKAAPAIVTPEAAQEVRRDRVEHPTAA